MMAHAVGNPKTKKCQNLNEDEKLKNFFVCNDILSLAFISSTNRDRKKDWNGKKYMKKKNRRIREIWSIHFLAHDVKYQLTLSDHSEYHTF